MMSIEVTAEVVRAVEAILLVAQEPVPTDLIAQLVEMPSASIEEVCTRLAETYEAAGHGFQIAKIAGGWRFQTHPDVAPYVERFILDGQRARLSGAALETLAIIAYKQPISRLQIASIRGVDPDAVMRTLHGRGYIAPVARDSGPGQATLWGTTQLFLEKLGLASLADMPPIASFVPDASLVEALEKTLRIEADPSAANADTPEEQEAQ
jgi:segregation and condensation protein B